MQGERLLELIKQCPELEKSKNGEKPFNMAKLTLPDSLENKNVWSLLFPTGGGDLCVAMVDRRSDREKSGQMVLDVQAINITKTTINYAATNWEYGKTNEPSNSAPHYAYAFLCNILPEIDWKESVTNYNKRRREKGLSEMKEEDVALMVFRLGYISRIQIAYPAEEMNWLNAHKKTLASIDQFGGSSKENMKTTAEEWKKGDGGFIRLSASSPWVRFSHTSDDFQKVMYYFMEMGQHAGMISRGETEKTEWIKNLLKPRQRTGS